VIATSLTMSSAGSDPLSRPKVGLMSWSPCGHVSFATPTTEWKQVLTELGALGYNDGNVDLVCQSSELSPNKLGEAADALVSEKPDVIVATSELMSTNVGRKTLSIPIVARTNFFSIVSPSQPGGNLTGVDECTYALTSKRMELLREALPGLKRVAIVFRPRGTGREHVVSAQRAAARLKLSAETFPISSESEIAAAFGQISATNMQAVFFLPDRVLEQNLTTIADLAKRSNLPTMSWDSRHIATGILLAYSCSSDEAERQLSVFVDKILKGSAPGNLPIEQPNGTILAVNLLTATYIGVALPRPVLRFASEFVE
jgi:putative ABC transport system substrate-binding protein